jgi:SAM-dependent methyltransferase
VAGSSRLYEQLQQYDWYYMNDKWEYRRAMQDLKGCGSVLEVGCGMGAFIKRVKDECGGVSEGVELNEKARTAARELGLTVHGTTLEGLISQGRRYDAVCAFQVLEHLPDPRSFLGDVVNLLKDNGRLILSVPANDAFIRHARLDVLNEPPHHMTQWHERGFRFLTKIFPLQITRILHEPLARYHVEWYLSVQNERLFGGNSTTNRVLQKILEPVLRIGSVRRFIKGHTLYACLQKRA